MRWTGIFLLAALAAPAAQALEVRAVSSRPDMVSGGDALVGISGADKVSVKLNGRDVTARFRPAGSGALLGRVTALELGKNSLKVAADGRSAKLELVNHPRTGPVFSGPHQTPFVCETERAGLGAPLDENCSVKTRAAYYYKSTDPQPEGGRRSEPTPRGFKPLDPMAERPADLAKTTTTEGKTVDYIVRVETGVINRAIYQIAMLHDPAKPLPDPWTGSDGWNGRLVYRFGGGCRAGYRQGGSRTAIDDASLSLGFATAASSLNVFGNNCDDVISAETMMMVKEHFIESFGPPIRTIGVGGSGGSMQQHLIAQNYPGLLDGIIPGASYPDPITLLAPVSDCSLLDRAFESSDHDWSDEQKTAVSGYATWKTCGSWMRTFSPGLIRPGNCAPEVPKEQTYAADHRPDGARCGFHDNLANVFGRDPKTGLTPRTLDNVGVQYGLNALNAGQISAEQFLELNETIGGYDADANFVPERSLADRKALEIAYRSGRVNSGGGSLGSIPIIDTRRYQDPTGNIHDRVRTFVMAARLERANGGAANRVVVTEAGRDVNLVELMNQWLERIANDPAADSAIEKIARNKPKVLTDSCWIDGQRVTDTARCDERYPAHGDPRLAAGAPLTNDILKCSLKPVDPSDYNGEMTQPQLERLRSIFPQGVCDYSRPGVGQASIEGTWLRY